MRPLHAFALSLLLVAISALAFAQPRASYVVIVHPSNPATALDRQFVEEAFLKKVTHWPNDEAIRPVDLAPNSPVRKAFTEEVLNRSIEAVKGYWQQRIFSGRDVPPPELESDEEVVKYVLKYPGGVGYVSAGAHANGAKVITVR